MFLKLDEDAFKKAAESLNLNFVQVDKLIKVTTPKELILED